MTRHSNQWTAILHACTVQDVCCTASVDRPMLANHPPPSGLTASVVSLHEYALLGASAWGLHGGLAARAAALSPQPRPARHFFPASPSFLLLSAPQFTHHSNIGFQRRCNWRSSTIVQLAYKGTNRTLLFKRRVATQQSPTGLRGSRK